VKRFEEETNLRCQLVLDVSSSMYYPREDFNKLKFSVLATASLIYLLKKQRDAFGLTFFAEDIELSTPAKSTPAHQKYLFTELERIIQTPGKNKKTSLSNALHTIAEQIHKRSLVIVFSDMLNTDTLGLEEIFSGLQHLKYRKHEVILFNVLDHKNELGFNFENRPYHFIDLETGEEIKVQPHQVQETYLKAFNSMQEELKAKCGQYSIDLIDSNIHEGFHKVLNNYLIKRNRLF
jgi:uncharacterized protein (DUF58 family)